ncbi:glutamine synthetase-like [Corticium candelabrum]|uniref:glutamine synthetase-like n=1 Tax=Corticium candelabrum TaxID=121492 RepID=UPI002E25728F|nr:glutamine synthetase-like [Corticium candelabrum]
MASKWQPSKQLVPQELEAFADQRGIRYFLFAYIDILGVHRGKLVPKSAVNKLAEEGGHHCRIMFRVSATDPDMVVVPDLTTLVQLPWKPEFAWVMCDLYSPAGVLFEESPRLALKRQVERLSKLGENWVLKCGLEFEFYLVNKDGTDVADKLDERPGIDSCFRTDSLMRSSKVLTRICDVIDQLGWHPYQIDHEGSSGQYEINCHYTDAMTMADRHVFFKYVCQSISEEEGVRITFMPKPFEAKIGNGLHMHVSVWEGEKNVFLDQSGELGLSQTAYYFLAGVLHNAKALCAIFCPTVNSYKRLVAAGWCPNRITYTGDNRSHMMRIPGPGRFEIRLADGAVNPYLYQAAVITAGIDGIERKLDPGRRCDGDGYKGEPAGAEYLPQNLLDATRELKKNQLLYEALGVDCMDAFTTLKEQEWLSYMRHLTEWERIHTLDC